MGKSTNGPDWEDIRTYLLEIQKSSQCTVTLIWAIDGWGVSPRWRIHAMATPHEPLVESGGRGIGVYATYPHRDYKSLEGCVFTLLARLDADLAREEFIQITRA